MTQTASVSGLWAGLSEARVIEGDAHAATVASLDGGRVEARIAVLGYVPRPNDRVLIGASPSGAWIVGVTHALRPVTETVFRREDGVTVVSVEGDLELAAQGTVRVTGKAIELDAPSVSVRSDRYELASAAIAVVAKVAHQRIDRLETRATKIVERAVETYREVDDLAMTRAGRVRTLVEDAYMLVSRFAKLRAKEDFAIDGEQIRLG